MATAYDDSYNQTPERIVRTLLGLGYRDEVLHYVGMSHYFRLVPDPAGQMIVDQSGEFARPCHVWHADFLRRCVKAGYRAILSLSYELFDEHCPTSWKQRFFDGTAARTGWIPPSTLLSPANDEAIDYLRGVAARFVRLMIDAGMAVTFQIGEPWWWQLPDGRICLYDEASLAHFQAQLGFTPPDIPSLSGTLSANQIALLDEAGHVLGNSARSIRDRVKQVAGPSAEVLILLFTPTILDEAAPNALRANLPIEYAWPNFDRLQVEDYDWLTDGAQALRRQAYAVMQGRLQYPLQNQDYLAGFVLRPEDAAPYWKLIDDAIDEAATRGVSKSFVWALPQVTRDGFHPPSYTRRRRHHAGLRRHTLPAGARARCRCQPRVLDLDLGDCIQDMSGATAIGPTPVFALMSARVFALSRNLAC